MAGLASAFSALRYRDFRWLWIGTFCSTGGQWIQQATLGWVAYEVTGSGTLLGAVLGVRAIPMLLLAPVTGVVADRFDRRHALAASQMLVVVISLSMAAALAFDWVRTWHFFAFSILAGVGAVFDRTLRGTLVFNSVPRAEAANAVALNRSPTMPAAIAFLVVAGVAEMLHATSHVTTLQMCAPEHMRGRVASLLPVFPVFPVFPAFIAVGAFIAGVSADVLGAPLVVVLFAVAGAFVAAVAWARSEPLRRVRLSRLIASGQTS